MDRSRNCKWVPKVEEDGEKIKRRQRKGGRGDKQVHDTRIFHVSPLHPSYTNTSKLTHEYILPPSQHSKTMKRYYASPTSLSSLSPPLPYTSQYQYTPIA
jgi:hypothetical protein